MLRATRLVILVALVLPAAACGSMGGTDAPRVPSGTWGGDRIRLDVTSSGAKIEYDCAHGTIDEAIVVDGTSRFSVAGTHTFERGGSSRSGKAPDRHPARYDGRVVGDTMEITVTVADTNRRIGRFMLFLNHSARLVKCR
jgi:hypothetical protein